VPGARTSATPAALDAKLTVLQGVGPRHAETLTKLGLQTLGDMLYYFPRRYDDYSQLKPIKDLFYGEQVTVIGTIQSAQPIRGGKATITKRSSAMGRAGCVCRSSTSLACKPFPSRVMQSPSRARSINTSDAS
jgi:RecG-like helicase